MRVGSQPGMRIGLQPGTRMAAAWHADGCSLACVEGCSSWNGARAVPKSTPPASTASEAPAVRVSPLVALPVQPWRARQGNAYR